MREPLESGEIWISRAAHQVRYPARFQLIAAMNPCPCGYYGDNSERCDCTPDRVQQYRQRVSGPLMDRIDLHVDVPSLPPEDLASSLKPSAHTANLDDSLERELVINARDRMLKRQGCLNAGLSSKGLVDHCDLDQISQSTLDEAVARLGISARGYFRILRVARTVADLTGCKRIDRRHLMEAIGYRRSGS